MWTTYFKFIKLLRGRVITPSHGEIDFSRDDLPVNTCKELFEKDFPYLEITEEGKKKLYGIETEVPSSTISESETPGISETKAILLETVETEVPPPNRKKYAKKKSSE